MPTLNGRNYTGVVGLNLREANGAIRFETPLITPTVTSGERLLYVNSSNQLIFQDGSSSTTIGGSGGGGVPTWETIFAADNTFTVTPDATFTITGNRSTATDVLTIGNAAGGSGSALQFTNLGSGNDIDGTGNTWGVSAAGAATFLTLTLSGTTITSTAADVAWALEDNDTTALIIGAAGKTNMMTFDTTNTTEIVRIGATGLAVTAGFTTMAVASNSVVAATVTNNTMTTLGAAANNTGALVVTSTSLTTGSLLQLNLSDTNNAGGFYLNCRETVSGTNDFTIGENGVIAMLGTASADAFIATNGNITLSAGSISVTNAADSVNTTLVNNTATTAAVFVLSATGAHTGTTTTSAMTLTLGSTSGTAIYVPTAALTTGKVMQFIAGAATDAILLDILGGAANMTSTGRLAKLAMGAATAGTALEISTTGAYSGTTGVVSLTANSMTGAGIALTISNTGTGVTTGSLIRATSGTTGAVVTNGLYSFVATGVYTSGGAGSLVGMFNVKAAVTTAGTIMNVTGGALVDGIALAVQDAGTGMTSGSLIRGATATTGALSVSGVYSFFGTGAHTGTTVGMVHVSSATAAGYVMSIAAASLTSGSALVIADGAGTGLAGGSLLKITTASTSAISTGVVAITASAAYTSTTNHGLLSLVANSVTAGATVLYVSGTAATTSILGYFDGGSGVYTGTGLLQLVGSGITTGIGMLVSNSGTMVTTGQLAQFTAAGATTATTVVGLTANAATSAVLLNLSGTGLTTGVGVKVTAAAATMTTGAYFQANDGSVNVFSVGLAGHLQFRGTAPSIAVTVQNGISACAVAASNTDTTGTITTTGTSTGSTTITLTFTKAYAIAPKVFLQAANAAACNPNSQAYISSTTTTTFVITIPPGGTYAATPSWHYWVAESGSAT